MQQCTILNIGQGSVPAWKRIPEVGLGKLTRAESSPVASPWLSSNSTSGQLLPHYSPPAHYLDKYIQIWRQILKYGGKYLDMTANIQNVGK